MLPGVHVFAVKEKKISQGNHFFKTIFRTVPACIHSRMQPLIGRCLQKIQQKAAGCRRLTASESDPALRVQIVKPVLQNYAHDIIHGHEPAAHLSGFRGTDFRASAAVPTLCTVKRRNSPSHDCGPGRTDLLARTAAGAEIRKKKHLRGRNLGFRIAAPEAVQRTAFQENRRPYARSILR